MTEIDNYDYDFIIIGSGFGGSVSALRLVEKGYKVLVLEKGKEFKEEDYPKTNWNLKRWMWLPYLRFHGIFKLSFFRHITILSGVGVGGGSLNYANTLPIPKKEYFESETWAHLANWENELNEFYQVALKMLGATKNPKLQLGDLALQKLAQKIGKEDKFEATDVGVYFGEPDKIVPDPYFNGDGPDRSGCNFCGGCMTGCRYNAKNTLDKNYLYLARKKGLDVQPESMVYDVLASDGEDGSRGYRVKWKQSIKLFKRKGLFTSKNIIFAAGVLGTIPLLLKLKKKSLPNLSSKIGSGVRTNSESLLGITTFDKTKSFCEGVAIGSILHTDKHTHLEPVRYASGSGFWRLLLAPLARGPNTAIRLLKIFFDVVRHPIKNLRVLFVWNFSKRTQILMFMQTINSTLRFSLGIFGLKSSMEHGPAPTAFIPETESLIKDYAETINGKPITLFTDTIFGIPTTAHILGGCVMGKDANEGVIDKDNHAFGYKNMWICDGSMISSNPGVNPSLSITALTERAMSKIPAKQEIALPATEHAEV